MAGEIGRNKRIPYLPGRRGRHWFIPVKLGACRITPLDIGPGETLDHPHHVDPSTSWDDGGRAPGPTFKPPTGN